MAAGGRRRRPRARLDDGAQATVATGPATDATLLLQGQHRAVAALFERAETDPAARERLLDDIDRHALLVGEIFYPELENASAGGRGLVRASREDQGRIRDLVRAARLDGSSLAPLREAVGRHVEREEQELFAEAQRVFSKDHLVALAERMEERYRELGGTGESTRKGRAALGKSGVRTARRSSARGARKR